MFKKIAVICSTIMLLAVVAFTQGQFNSGYGSTEVGTTLTPGNPYFGPLLSERVQTSNTSGVAGFSSTGRTETAVGWEATINPPVSSGFVRVTFVDATQVPNPYANYTTFPPPYNQLSCDIPTGSSSCSITYPAGVPVAMADQLEPVIWLFGTGTNYIGQVNWTLDYQ